MCEVYAEEISERGWSVIAECIVPSWAEISHGARDARPVPVARHNGQADYGRNNKPMTNGIRRQRVGRPTDGWPLSWKYGADFAGFYMPVYRQMASALRRILEIDHSDASGMVPETRYLPTPLLSTPHLPDIHLTCAVYAHRSLFNIDKFVNLNKNDHSHRIRWHVLSSEQSPYYTHTYTTQYLVLWATTPQ